MERRPRRRRGRVSGWWMVLGALLAFAALPLAILGWVAGSGLDFHLDGLFDFDLDPYLLPFAAMREEPGEIVLGVTVPGEYGIWGHEPGPIELEVSGPDGAAVAVEAAPPGYRCEVWDRIFAVARESGEDGPELVALGRFVAPEAGRYVLLTGTAPPSQRISCIRTWGEGDPVFDAYLVPLKAQRQAEADLRRAEERARDRLAQKAYLAAAAVSLVSGIALWFTVLVRNGQVGCPRTRRGT